MCEGMGGPGGGITLIIVGGKPKMGGEPPKMGMDKGMEPDEPEMAEPLDMESDEADMAPPAPKKRFSFGRGMSAKRDAMRPRAMA